MSRSVALLAVLGLACSGDGPRGVPDAGGQTHARLVLTVTVPRDAEVALALQARMLRYHDLDLESAEILSGATHHHDPGPGRCALVDPEALVDETLMRLSADAAVELLDAGDLMFRAARSAVRLSPRYAPDLLPFVSGAVYRPDVPLGGELQAAAPELGVSDEVIVSAFGGDDVGAFEAHVAIPPLPRLAGPAALLRGSPLEVTWSVQAGEAGDRAMVVLAAAGVELRCHALDVGRWTFPRDAIQAFVSRIDADPDRVEADAVALSVEREARTPIAAAGLDGGELIVIVRDVVSLPIE